MTITYPEVQISGTAEEICAVLQCLMLNVSAGSLREEMDLVAKAIGKEQPSIEEFFTPVTETEQDWDENEIPDEPEEYGDTPEEHMMQAIFEDTKPTPQPEPEEKPSQEPEKKHAPKTGKTAPQAVELRAKGGEWVRYESLTEAAAAIGVRQADIRRSLMHGWLVKGYEVRAEGKERKQPKIGYHTCGKPRKVDVKVDNEWYTFDKLTDAAKFIGCGANNLATSIAKGKYKGYEVRYHVDDSGQGNPELDAILKEIEDRNKQPYEISSRL